MAGKLPGIETDARCVTLDDLDQSAIGQSAGLHVLAFGNGSEAPLVMPAAVVHDSNASTGQAIDPQGIAMTAPRLS
jgi:hypothetical protein